MIWIGWAKLVICLALAALVTREAAATFTDVDSLGANSFGTGRITLTLSPSTALVTFSQMLPGDTVTAPLVVSNGTGGQPLRYAVTASAGNSGQTGLRDQLVLTVRTGDAGTPTTCTGFSGTQLYTGPVRGNASGLVVGNPAQGNHAGDRTLTAGASETVCFRVHLPLTTGNAFQNASTTATFTFHSEQTKNN